MSATLLRTPAHNPGLTVLHNSRALAAYAPLIFEWTRRDYAIDSVSENAGRSNQLDVVIAGIDLTTDITDGAQIWVEATGHYSGLATVVSTSFSTDTTIETDVLRNAGAVAESDFINLIDDRPNYRLLCDFVGVDGTGVSEGSIVNAIVTPGPGPLFRMSIDAGPFVRAELDTVSVPDYEEGVTFYQKIEERGQLFYISYSELWDGAVPSAQTTDNFLALPAYKGARDRYGESAINLEVWPNSLGDDYKPQLVHALPNPVYFPGWPFFAGFAYQDIDEPTWSLLQNNEGDGITPSTTNTNTVEPEGGFHLVSVIDPERDDLQNIRLWLEVGLFWSFWTTFDYAIRGATFTPTVNQFSGATPSWLFENGAETVGAVAPNVAQYSTALDGTLQEVKVTGITADLIQTFSVLNTDVIAQALSFEPCSLLSSIYILNQPNLTQITGPTQTANNMTNFNVGFCSGLTSIDLSGAAIMSGNFACTTNVALTNIIFPTVAGYAFDTFTISGCTSFTQQIPLGIKFPYLMGANNSAVTMTGNGWSATLVDYYLTQLDEACPFGFTGRTIDISGNTAPTAASLGARTSLALKGVGVTTD